MPYTRSASSIGERIVLPGLCLFVSMSGGCQLEYEADTIIKPNEQVVRTTRYIAGTDDDRTVLERDYTLPPGGVWREEERPIVPLGATDPAKRVPQRCHVYESVQQYALGQPLARDYDGRPGGAEFGVERNAPQVAVTDHVLVKFFTYTNRFQGSMTKEQAAMSMRRYYRAFVEYFANRLQARSDELVTAAQARPILAGLYDPVAEKIAQGILSDGAEALHGPIYQAETDGLEGPSLVDRVADRLPAPMGHDEDWWRAVIAEARADMSELTWPLFVRSFAQDSGASVQGVNADGAQIFSIGVSHFRERVTLPGRVLATNANRREGATLIWEFDNDKFSWGDYTLHARSRLIYPGRIALAALLGVAGPSIFIRRRRRMM